MTKQEFEERYGRKVSQELFDNINDLYMEADDMDKDTFVKEYKKHEESMLLQIIFSKEQAQKAVIDNLRQQLSEFVDKVLYDASENMNETLLSAVEDLIGKKKFILRKIAMHIQLTNDDLDYVKMNLK